MAGTLQERAISAAPILRAAGLDNAARLPRITRIGDEQIMIF
jgi:hypothetical protein